MSEFEIHLFAKEEVRARALENALARLASGPLPSLEVNRAGSVEARHEVSIEDALALVNQASAGSPWEVSADVMSRAAVRASDAAPSLISVYCVSVPRTSAGRFELIMSRSALWDDVIDIPTGRGRNERQTLASQIWTRAVTGLLLAATSADREGGARIRMSATLCEDGASFDPFSAYAVAHTDAEAVVDDIARGWLCAHTRASMADVALEEHDKLRARVEGATDAESSPNLRRYSYQGSLSRLDVLRILDAPASEVAVAVEAAGAHPESDAASRAEVGPLAFEQTTLPSKLSFEKLPYSPRVTRYQSGGLLLTAGPFQPIWGIYRDAAALLLA